MTEARFTLSGTPGESIIILDSCTNRTLLEIRSSPRGFITVLNPMGIQKMQGSNSRIIRPLPTLAPPEWSPDRIWTQINRWAMNRDKQDGEQNRETSASSAAPVEFRKEFRERAREMFRAETRILAAQNADRQLLRQYNTATIGEEELARTSREFPGAVIWAFRFLDPQEEPRDGQRLIEMVKHDMAQSGIEEECLPYLPRMSQGALTEILRQHRKHEWAITHLSMAGQACREWVKHCRTRDHNILPSLEKLQESIFVHSPQESILDEIIRMTQPELHQEAQEMAPCFKTTSRGLDQHLIMSMGPAAIQEMKLHNPGAIAWAMQDPGCPIRPIAEGEIAEMEQPHPGQIITAVKKQLEQDGLDPRHWRKFTLTPIPLVMAITSATTNREERMRTIHALMESGARPEPNTLQSFTFMTSYGKLEGEPRQTFMKLGLRESERRPAGGPRDQQAGLISEARNIMDYLKTMQNEGSPVQARSWGGLKRRSAAWRRRLLEQTQAEDWEREMARTGHQQRLWNSLVETPMKIGDFTIVHLGSQKMLWDESTNMKHCVRSYSPACAGGRSRVFSIRSGETPTATGEIRLHDSRWRAAQVRGPHNHPAGEGETKAMEELAQRYTQEWEKNPDHHFWSEETGENG